LLLKSRRLYIPMVIRKIVLFIGTFFLFLFSFLSCEKQSTPIESKNPTTSLTVEEVAVTEVWLNLATENLLNKDILQVFRDDSVIYTGKPGPADTTLYDSGLLPAHSYSYHASLTRDNQVISKSNPQSITTMDTTSHNFQWEVIEFPSPYGSGVLRDVAIVNENDIWCVGEIYADSVKPWLPYNAVHWDGNEWELKRIYVEYMGQPNLAPLEGLFVLSDGNIIFSSGLPYIPEGDHWILYHLWDMGVLNQSDGGVPRIWGTSLQNLYFAGRKGTLVHYNGSSWQKLNSGTELPIMDIYGVKKDDSGRCEILCVAEHISPGGSKVLSIESTNVRELPTPGLLSWGLWGIWFMPGREYIVVGSGVWRSHSLETNWALDNRLPTLFSTSIDGTDLNDVVVAGAFWLLAHYNGMNWKTYFPATSGSFGEVAIRGNLVIAVGDIDNSAVVVRGQRL
jgi:hypothetical protein